MAIPQSFIQELLARVDVVDVVGRHVTLKKGGANFMGLCPFHGEKSPSFSVSPAKQFYHCFGCGASGDAIKFLTEYTGASFIEAVNDLAQQFGLQVPEEDISPQERARQNALRQKQSSLSETLEKAGEAYRHHLKQSPKAVQYLKNRGLSGQIAKHFGLGYAPEGWRTLASVFPNYNDSSLEESGLVIASTEEDEKRYDRFRDRIMFPIRNVKGECIGFGGRVLGDDKPKYLNSPETPVFSKGRELYGLFEARQALREQGYALVTEGYMDVVALAQLGFPNAVATLGTACTAEHVQKLFRFTESVVFSFDGDAAGRRAARKALDAAIPLATDTRSVKFLFLPAEHDPDSFIREFGAEAFARHVHDALPLSRFLVEAAREQCDTGTAEGRAHMAANARPLWSALPDGVLKRQLLSELAQLAQINAAELAAVWQSTSKSVGIPTHSGPTNGSLYSPEPSVGWPPYSAAPPGQSAEKTPFKKPFTPNSKIWGQGGRFNSKFAAKPIENDSAPRVLLSTREDQVLRLLLTDLTALDALTFEDRELLGQLPAPHGDLFHWLERQVNESGALPWAALKPALHSLQTSTASAAERLMAHPLSTPMDEPQAQDFHLELQVELRATLDRMLVDKLKMEERSAIAAAATEPGALSRYRQLQQRRLELERHLAANSEE
jgi:DNA primase